MRQRGRVHFLEYLRGEKIGLHSPNRAAGYRCASAPSGFKNKDLFLAENNTVVVQINNTIISMKN